MAVSAFDLFKIGIGPSSSHTVGPMRAAKLFVERLAADGLLERTERVACALYGSLGATGKGHGSDKAVLLGLLGEAPDTVDVDGIADRLHALRATQRLTLLGRREIAFDEAGDLHFHRRESLPLHANGMRLQAFDAGGAELANRCYYSVGGGFVLGEEQLAGGGSTPAIVADATALPLPFHSGEELLQRCAEIDGSIADVMRRNERVWRGDAEIDAGLLQLWHTMQACVERGLRTDGNLPGGYKVRRRAVRSRCHCAAARRSRRSARGDRLGQPVGAGRQRGERRGRARRDRADQRRGRHRAGGSALLQPLHPRGQ